MTIQIETRSLFAQKLLLLLQYFRAIRIIPVREEIDENSADYQAFLVDLAHAEVEKGGGIYTDKKGMLQLLSDL